MKVTKYGQCCLLIEIAGKRILTDPGKFSRGQDELTDIDLVLITHEHADHFHSESLAAILANNPKAEVITNSSVGKVLTQLGVEFEILEGSATTEKGGLSLEAFDGPHVEIFGDYNLVQNTGYFINHELFYPGDAYTNPKKPVPVLALPVSGPWCKIADSLNYALAVRPQKAFPVHDVFLNEDGVALIHGQCQTHLSAHGITFVPLKNGETIEL